MRSTINVSLNKISQNQGIYPRFSTDYERVKLFIELAEIGEKFPPVKIVKNGDFYVLLDGNHRVEAWKKLGKEKIPADVFNVPERLWRLSAARFNNKSSMPLKGEELKKVIENAWTIDNIHDTYEIARELGCSDRYVRKVLQPIRERERKKKEDQVRKMRERGFSKKETAHKLELSRATLYRIEKTKKMSQNGTVPKWASHAPLEFAEGKDENKTVDNSVDNSSGMEKRNKNAKEMAGYGTVPFPATHAPLEFAEGEDENKTVDNPVDKVQELSTAQKLTDEAVSPIDTLSMDISDNIHGINEKNEQEAGEEPFPDSALDDPDYPDWVDWKPGMRETQRALDMIRDGWSIERISKRLDVSPVWVRNTALAMLFVQHYGYREYSKEEIVEKFRIDENRVEYIIWLQMYFRGIAPDRRTLALWLQTYPPPYQDPRFLELLRREQIYQKCKEEGKKCPWEYQEDMPRPFTEFPVDISDKFFQVSDFINGIADLASLGLFQEEKVEKELLNRMNLLYIGLNNIKDILRQKNYLNPDEALKLEAYNYIHGKKGEDGKAA